MSNRRAQVVMEFLSTYGWALLSLLVVLGAMIYFGVFTPTDYVPGTCLFGPEINCEDYQVYYDTAKERTYVAARLRSSVVEVADYSAWINETQHGWNGTCFIENLDGSSKDWSVRLLPQSTFTLYCYFKQKSVVGEQLRTRVHLRIVPQGKYPRIVNGEIRNDVTNSTSPADP